MVQEDLTWYLEEGLSSGSLAQVADKCIINPSYASVWNMLFSSDCPGDVCSFFFFAWESPANPVKICYWASSLSFCFVLLTNKCNT